MKTRLNSARLSGLAVAMLVASPALAAGPACLRLPPAKVAMQLYSVGSVVGAPMERPAPGAPASGPKATPAQLDKAFGDLRAIGWRNMENFGGNWSLPDAGYVAAVKRNGLQLVSSHDNLDLATWDGVLDRASAAGQSYVGSGGFGVPGIDTLEHVLQTAVNLNALGEKAAKRGLKFFVHSHQLEIKNRFDVDLKGSGKTENLTVLDIVAAKTDPRFVSFEVDIGWAAAAFGLNQQETAEFLAKHRQRVKLVHVKDMTPESRPTDLGRGVLDYSKLVAAAGPQIDYYIWEYDRPPEPMTSAKIAYAYLTCQGD